MSLPNNKDNGILTGDSTGIIDETGYHPDAIKCAGCGLSFTNTLRDGSLDDDLKYCGNCFFHVYGLKQYQDVLKNTTKHFQICWHTEITKLPKEVVAIIDWTDKKLPERLGLK